MPSSDIQESEKVQFAAICARMPNNALIAAECANLTGGVLDSDGFARCKTVEHIHQAAYIRTGLRVLAQGSTLDELLDTMAQVYFDANDFRIDFLSLAQAPRVSSQTAIVEIANAIPFRPNLDHPQHRFLIVERDHGLWFGEIIAESQHSYSRHDAKPYRTSTSLPSRIARAMVNLVVPGANSLIDPCCGTGSILLEAQALGISVYGADQNKMMVGMARKNLAHFGYYAVVEQTDIRSYQRTADALVTDLPYGRLLSAEENIIRPILEHGRKLAPVAVYVTENDITDWLVAAGYHNIVVFPISKRASFARFVHLAQVEGKNQGP